MWEMGHTFDEIDRMSIEDFGDVIGYWREKSRAEEKLNKQRQGKGGR